MAEPVDLTPEYCSKSILILGCGNVLLGDDGFGPEVVAYLESHYPIPENVAVLDAGTGVGDILLDVALADRKPRKLVLVDVLDRGQEPGDIAVQPLDGPPQRSGRNISPHQAPTSSLLKELEALGKVEVLLLTVQPLLIPQEVQPGLSDPVRGAVPRACDLIARSFFGHA
ncbi:MAG: hydrogenase maturation protease [Chloroflexota bacterium]|nr:hydrogenase maturation protease [Chloroflexota bacterium]